MTHTLAREVDVYYNRIEVARQVVWRPEGMSPQTWRVTWGSLSLLQRYLVVYRDRVEVFDQIVMRPDRIARSQWFTMWGETEGRLRGWASLWG